MWLMVLSRHQEPLPLDPRQARHWIAERAAGAAVDLSCLEDAVYVAACILGVAASFARDADDGTVADVFLEMLLL